MAWIILILIGIILFVLYISYSERDRVLKVQVDSYGGMMKKYELLVENLLLWPDSKVTEVTRDKITIIATGRGLTIETYIITEGPNYVEVKWELLITTDRKKAKQWRFPHDSSQQLIINKLAEDI